MALALAGLAGLLVLCGLAAGSEGWSLQWLGGWAAVDNPAAAEWALVLDIRAPRTLGALLTGGLLGLAGAIAQGLFRNPLADPYLLGSAAGAGLGVVLVLAAGGALGHYIGLATASSLLRVGLVGAAFAGAVLGVLLTLLLARGTGRPMVLLLAGVVVGILLSSVSELVTLVSPEALRGKQIFMLGSTSFLGWPGSAVLGGVLLPAAVLAWRYARALDALVLGEDSAASLGLPLRRARLLLVLLMALATGTAVAQAGLVAFVGLVAPHLVRRVVVVTHGPLLLLSAAAGGVLLLAADVAARSVMAPQELPVGVLTAVLGGVYLMVLLRHRQRGLL
ncbi:FecCD family ABC transporter permease [Rubrivivax rivuli]|uniref:Iron ABC transporter permease n=1 Tax=Rubrivivax rivuli TaxID=1862385 RepID=A0A437RFZ0_9BURK|nr:iron ABC transporter permease [Rubrivivax rivuli]RVU45628.1 iron ABC transporter permease [Rubrivivax rivuli]